MKKINLLILLILIILCFFGCSHEDSKLAYFDVSLEQLFEFSPIIVECDVTGDNIKFKYENIDFVKTDIVIKKVLRDINSMLNNKNTITILQSDTEDIPVIKKGEKLILFLSEYEGPIIDNSYVIKGAQYGVLKIKDNKITAKYKNDANFENSIKQEIDDIEKIEEMSEKIKYNPSKYIKSLEEMKTEKEQEQKLIDTLNTTDE